MSSKKKNKKHSGQPARDITTEQLTKQMNTEEEPQERTSSEAIIAEYERKALEAEQRMAERLRASEQERAEKELRASTPLNIIPSKPIEQQIIGTENDTDEAKENPESDVKEFIPRSAQDKEQTAESFTEGFNEALSENSDELEVDNGGTSETPSETEQENEQLRPNRFYLVFAVFVIIMSVIGIISTVNFCSGIVSNIANRTELKNELALFLYPVVCVDPPDCDSTDELPSTIIIESAIWRIILTGDNTNYEKLYNTYMYVPAIDVEYSVRSIFGNAVAIEHQTVGTMDITFTYVEDTNSYLVPINPHYTAYSPRIKDISNVGELYTVTVEYIPPSALAVEGIEFEVNPQKTMVYTLSKRPNVSVIHSIKNITRLDNSYAY